MIFPARSRPKKNLGRPEEYKKKVAEYVKKYATEEALRDQCGGEQVINVKKNMFFYINIYRTISPPLQKAPCLTFQKMKPRIWSCNNNR